MPAPHDRVGFLDVGPDTRSLEFRGPDGVIRVHVETWTERESQLRVGDCSACDWTTRGDDRTVADAEAQDHFNTHLDEKELS